MTKGAKAELAQELKQALALLNEHHGQSSAIPTTEPLQSLLAQCQEMVAARAEPVPIRTLHHFACTGGTLISKCLALMPNVTLLSEIDPLSRMQQSTKVANFWPSDILFAGRIALRPISEEMTIRSFNAGVAELHRSLSQEGRSLVLRDHAHSHFCGDIDPMSRPTLRSMLLRIVPVRSVVTVRHPLDSFLSLKHNGWEFLTPFTLETYAERYALFLKVYDGLPMYRYEDFLENPDAVLAQICDDFELPFQRGVQDHLKVVKLTGDSGRGSTRIGPRPRRPVPEEIAKQARTSAAYHQLCERLDYPADSA